MSTFWGYAGADILAIIVITTLSLFALYDARRFVSKP